ncbi:hypothetical protein HOLleu_19390 [Holothuria leucospilota]|uniref:Uncharacterized protein n=1 Tax=Holothuria leucospilota TaxID=206669 RepID=A0A9Q1BZY8_HOLLE|nr:hypothetical protein HOLleu_19390 [Holothuria leucospilota]
MECKSNCLCLSMKALCLLFVITLLEDSAQTYVLPRSQLDASYRYTREDIQYGYENRDPNNFPETFQDYQYGYGNRNPNNFPETGHESFVIIQDNTMMSANYNNAVDEIYLDAGSSPDHQHLYDYGRGGALEGPQPTFEREDVDGEDLETVREFNDYHLVPYNGRAPSGIEYDVDGLDYVAHDPRVLEDVAKNRAAYAGGNTDDEDYIAQNQNYPQRDSWGFSL